MKNVQWPLIDYRGTYIAKSQSSIAPPEIAMGIKSLVKQALSFLCVLFFLLIVSCEKNGELDTDIAKAYHLVSASWYYYGGNTNDEFVVEIQLQQNGLVVENQRIGETLTVSGSVSDKALVFNTPEADTEAHLVLKSAAATDSSIILDTVVDLRKTSSFQFIQLTSDDLPTLYSGYDTSEEPDPDSVSLAKYQYYYTDTALPDSIKLVFYSYNKNNTPYAIDKLDRPAKDSVMVCRGKFSDYVALNCFSTDYAYLFLVKDGQTDSVIQNMKVLSPLLDLNTATGYSTAISNNVKYNATEAGYQTKYKFVTALLYKNGSKYLDKTLFTSSW